MLVFSIIRKAGAYGEVPVDWELTSVDGVTGQASMAFNMTKGTIVFPDGVRMRNITLQVLICFGLVFVLAKSKLPEKGMLMYRSTMQCPGSVKEVYWPVKTPNLL